MKSVVWSPEARRAFDEYLVWLQERDEGAARRAEEEISGMVAALGRRTVPGRPSKWEGLRVISALDWRKIIVFQVADDHIRIAGFYDSRQDERRLRFQPE